MCKCVSESASEWVFKRTGTFKFYKPVIKPHKELKFNSPSVPSISLETQHQLDSTCTTIAIKELIKSTASYCIDGKI